MKTLIIMPGISEIKHPTKMYGEGIKKLTALASDIERLVRDDY